MKGDPLLEAPPLEREHPATWALLRLDDVHAPSPERERLFAEAMREITLWHDERNEAYRAWCRSHGFSPRDDLAGPDDTARIPALPASAFKERDLTTLRSFDLFGVSSSGTGGRATALPLDLETVTRMWAMGRATLEEEGLFADEGVDYAVLAPDPRSNPGHGNAQFFAALMRAAPVREVRFALRRDGGDGLAFDPEGAADLLRRCAAARRPARLLGLPALLARLASAFLENPIRLPAASLVLTGAGWKGEAHAAIPKPAFRALVERAFGIPDERVRDLYGMTEHAVHYLECRQHRFHAPVFSRVAVVDPLTRRPVAAGEAGVLHLVNPGITTLPVHSLLTADVGRLVRCGCGRPTPAFEVVGRGGTTRHRGCAATTLERVAR